MKAAKRLGMVLAVTAVSLFVLGSAVFAAGRRAAPAPQAWLHIEGQTPALGIPVVMTGRPADGRASVMIKGNEDFLKMMKSQYERGARFDQVKLVVRENPSDKREIVYTLSNVAIESILGEGTETSTISMRFDKMSTVAGVWQNPGVPPGAPAIVASGINKGWVHFAETKDPNGMPVNVIAYTSTEGSGLLKLTFESSEALHETLAGLLHEKKTVDMLILMLPERESRRYIEYKLARASVLSLSDARGSNWHEVVFNSNEIECYTGENSK
jgi:hypothetical protein